MRIALIGLQSEHTPPVGYGATGRIVAALATALSRHVEVLPLVAEGSGMSLASVGGALRGASGDAGSRADGEALPGSQRPLRWPGGVASA